MRRLAAILAAAVVGYSRLMGEDEAGTLAALHAHRAEVFDPVIAERGGRLVKLMGDGALVEFPSVVEAGEAALAIQQQVAAGDGPIRLRIGINLGDVIIDGDDIYGDGVNVAARLEALAEPGGVCISSVVHESIGNRVEAEFGDAGEHEVKGIDRPIRVWQWPATDAAHAPLALPEKPSVAILPFDNMSGDPEHEYFSDGITDDIATDLSKVSGLFVIARNATAAYKGRAAGLKQVAHELGVRYVLEGSVRRVGGKVRINARLTDANSTNQLWAERFDGELKDIFALQDQITENVVAALAVTLTRAEQSRALGKETKDLQAYDYVLHGNSFHHRMTKEDNHKAKEMFERAIERDPEYAPAYAGLAWALVHDSNQGWSSDAQRTLKAGLENAERAVVLDNSLAKAHLVLGDAYCWTKRHERAVAEGRRAVALDPSYADGHMALAYYLVTAGYAEEGVEEVQKALRFNPLHANRLYYGILSTCHYMLKQYEAAIEAAEQAVSCDPEHFEPHMFLASAFAQLEKTDEARKHAQEIMRLNPSFSSQHYAESLPFKNKTDLDHRIDGLRKAGLPE